MSSSPAPHNDRTDAAAFPPGEGSPLQSPLRFLPGVGSARAALLEKLDLRTVDDVLWRLPRDVLDLTQVKSPVDLVEGELQTVRGVVAESDSRETRRGTLTAALLDCGDDFVRALWFNAPWMRQKMQPGSRWLFSGKPKKKDGRWEFSHPRLQQLGEEDDDAHGGVVTRYGLTEGLRLHEMKRVVHAALEQGGEYVSDPLPAPFASANSLIALTTAVRQVHEPRSMAEYESARRRLLFDDLLEFQVGVALRRRLWGRRSNPPVLPVTAKIDARIRRLFPFPFTNGQNAAIRDIITDLQSGRAMHRLLQADVGAGKTVVAIYAMLVAIAAQHQAVLMAPTELLAMQHWRTIDGFLEGSRVRRALLTGSLTDSKRRDVRERLAAGELDLVIGTQAVIQEGVNFAKLGVAVIDEQHKFGVAQRSRFAGQSSMAPHVLVMTATPIPRSLCLTQFGDLDLTSVTDLPPGRQKIVTSRVTAPTSRRKAWEFIRGRLQQGRQLYVVCPLIEGDEATGRAGAAHVFEQLQQSELAGVRLGLVHGQLDRDDRDERMEQFRHGELQGIVATTVIEVGVDVPNATLMVVLDAERFGLSQLHQLRGRIGRGSHQGYCFLFSESNAPDAVARLSALEATSSGFEIAEKDFELRGPGDVLGTRQHGELPLRSADLVRDRDLLEETRTAAMQLVESGEIDTAEFAPLKLIVLDRFAELMDLPRTG
ncbi:ATP-dependent DNA helicase RecG [Caulifigura coniformis]|uniref:Probable DNA 3'-5' helicase RecG n=1 Tax=Caulifigura coniformis TaxID=2527983 RepID=A0A517S9P2_9PLAN|nr:ATP-dependent DNA helicase RecG [Caulifigura coniformis]QDT52848.1 ATP-dependent DNA helicase RecG [Caulifigura coniformis]